jgi:hypothetical protein
VIWIPASFVSFVLPVRVGFGSVGSSLTYGSCCKMSPFVDEVLVIWMLLSLVSLGLSVRFGKLLTDVGFGVGVTRFSFDVSRSLRKIQGTQLGRTPCNVNFKGRGARSSVLIVVGVPRTTCLEDDGGSLNRASIPATYRLANGSQRSVLTRPPVLHD